MNPLETLTSERTKTDAEQSSSSQLQKRPPVHDHYARQLPQLFFPSFSYDGFTLHDQLLEKQFETTLNIFSAQIGSEQVQGLPREEMMIKDE